MFLAFLNGLEVTHPKQKVSAKDVQDVFNEKFAQASGIPGGRMPYSSMNRLGITMEGLPAKLKLRHPTKYGCRQLSEIFKVRQDLKCIIPESIEKGSVPIAAAEPSETTS